jgi:hypothetical protein
MGKYRIAACPRQLPCGQFAAQVSIASGRGSASTDRVMRFHDEFSSHDAAAQFAIAQGIDWVHATRALIEQIAFTGVSPWLKKT